MAILNYTTQIKVEKTFAEISKILSENKVSSIMAEYDSEGNICAIQFSLNYNNQFLSFRLPSRINGVLEILNLSNASKKLKTKEQAYRVSWRIIKDWISAQMALVKAELADVKEVFLPYLVINSGNTLYNAIDNDNYKSLPL